MLVDSDNKKEKCFEAYKYVLESSRSCHLALIHSDLALTLVKEKSVYLFDANREYRSYARYIDIYRSAYSIVVRSGHIHVPNGKLRRNSVELRIIFEYLASSTLGIPTRSNS